MKIKCTSLMLVPHWLPREKLSKELQSCQCLDMKEDLLIESPHNWRRYLVKETGTQEMYASFVQLLFVQAPVAVFSPLAASIISVASPFRASSWWYLWIKISAHTRKMTIRITRIQSENQSTYQYCQSFPWPTRSQNLHPEKLPRLGEAHIPPSAEQQRRAEQHWKKEKKGCWRKEKKR